MQQTTDGGYIISGNFAAGAAFLIKTDSCGGLSWSRTFSGGKNGNDGSSVQQTADGGYIISGEFYGNGILKTDSDGNCVWTQTYGNLYLDPGIGGAVRQTADGGYIIVGSILSADDDIYLIKTDSSGDCVWARTYGGSGIDSGYSVRQTADNGYIISGLTGSFGAGSYDMYLIKTDSNGDCVWSQTYGGWNLDEGRSVEQTIDGGYVVIVRTNSFDPGNMDIYLIKTDSSGDCVWARTYAGSGNAGGYSVQQTTDGGYILAGGAYLIKTDSSGDCVWTRTLDAGVDSVQQTTDGGYITAGSITAVYPAHYYVDLIKTDADGNDQACPFTNTPTFTIAETATYTFTPADTASFTVSPTMTLTDTPYPAVTESPVETATQTIASTFIITRTITPTVTPVYGFSGDPVVYPNPFEPNKTKLKFLNMPLYAIVEIYTISGEVVAELHADYPAVYWDGKNPYGKYVSPGIYFYTVKNDDAVILKGKLFIMEK